MIVVMLLEYKYECSQRARPHKVNVGSNCYWHLVGKDIRLTRRKGREETMIQDMHERVER